MTKNLVGIPILLFIVSMLFRVLDIFVFRLDELIGEVILSKSLGFILVVVYVWKAGRKLSDIGFHTRALSKALFIGGITVGGLFAISYGVQLIAFLASGQTAQLTLSAIDPKTGMAGGFLFALWLVVGNIVNSAMEEGLFRGVMLTHFRARFGPRTALGLQAVLFAIWHLVWPLKNYLTGEADPGQAIFEAIGLLISTGIGGLFFGYLYYKTNNIWSAFLAHFINNTVLNIVFIATVEGLQSGVIFSLFLAIWLLGYLALIPLTSWLAKKYSMPSFTAWRVEVSP